MHGFLQVDDFTLYLGQLDQELLLVLLERGEGTVVSSEFFAHLGHFLVVFEVIPHELEEGLLLHIVLNLPFQEVAVALELNVPVLVNLHFVLG